MYLMGTWWVECGGDQKTVTIPRKRQAGSMRELSAPAARIHKLLVWRGQKDQLLTDAREFVITAPQTPAGTTAVHFTMK